MLCGSELKVAHTISGKKLASGLYGVQIIHNFAGRVICYIVQDRPVVTTAD